MIIKSAEFVTSAVKPDQYPPPDYPEIAFAGRSNVGKSSLINKLIQRKRLVKTSSTPGRTQLINFFIINEALMMVDLPGYGYAKVPEAVRKKWGPMIETYLSRRATLKAVVVLMDLRRTPGIEERNLFDWLQNYGIAAIPVLTKSDKLSKTQQKKQALRASQTLTMPPEQMILFSAKTGLGREAIWQRITACLEAKNER